MYASMFTEPVFTGSNGQTSCCPILYVLEIPVQVVSWFNACPGKLVL